MRCHLCLRISWQPLCKTCLDTLLAPTPHKRVLEDGMTVYSFYKYSEISKLLLTKHTYIGAKIFAQLGAHVLPQALRALEGKGVYIIPIDDHIRSGYSHTAVLAKQCESLCTPLYGALRAKNHGKYAGQSRHSREQQKRDFILTSEKNLDVILLDDIVTTGNTLKEANAICSTNTLNVLFAITLADAKED